MILNEVMKMSLRRCLSQHSLWSQSETSHTPSLFSGDLSFISYCVLSCIINATKYNIFYLKVFIYSIHRKMYTNKIVQDIFSPFDLCLKMYDKYFIFPAHKSSQNRKAYVIIELSKWIYFFYFTNNVII